MSRKQRFKKIIGEAVDNAMDTADATNMLWRTGNRALIKTSIEIDTMFDDDDDFPDNNSSNIITNPNAPKRG